MEVYQPVPQFCEGVLAKAEQLEYEQKSSHNSNHSDKALRQRGKAKQQDGHCLCNDKGA